MMEPNCKESWQDIVSRPIGNFKYTVASSMYIHLELCLANSSINIPLITRWAVYDYLFLHYHTSFLYWFMFVS